MADLVKPKAPVTMVDAAGVTCLTPEWNDFVLKSLFTSPDGKAFMACPRGKQFGLADDMALVELKPVKDMADIAQLRLQQGEPDAVPLPEWWQKVRSAGNFVSFGTSNPNGLASAIEDGPIFLRAASDPILLAGPKASNAAMLIGTAGYVPVQRKLNLVGVQQAGAAKDDNTVIYFLGGVAVLGLVAYAYSASQKKHGYAQNRRRRRRH